MHPVVNFCFWFIAVLLTTSLTAEAQKECVVGDIIYLDGDSIGYIGLECVDQYSFDAMTSTCVNGIIVDTLAVIKCNDFVKYCIQCGVRAEGAAVCLFSPDEPCRAPDATNPIVYASNEITGTSLATGAQAECLVGDIIYFDGDSIGFLGLECLDDSSFDAMTSTCVNGAIVDTLSVMKCDDIVPYCVQCGPRAAGAALCLSSPDDICSAVDSISSTGMITGTSLAAAAGGMTMGSGGMGGMGNKGMGGDIGLDAVIGLNGEMGMGAMMNGGKKRVRNLQTADNHRSKPLRGSSM